MSAVSAAQARLPMRPIVRAWWPLAASWLLMSAELPAVSALIARLAHPEINLAAYGGVVFPLALIIESPILMLLAASTALSKDWRSYLKVRRFMMWLSAALTLLHGVVAFTPLYYVLAHGLIGAPTEIVEPARLGLMIMLPWTWSIAYRRFNQGVLIRYDHSHVVGLGTLVRFCTLSTALIAAGLVGTLPGIVAGTGAVIAGVMAEAAYIGWRVQPVLRDSLRRMPAVEPALTFRAFLNFYIPLLMTAFLTLGAQPVISAALSRMPMPLESLAVWPVMTGVLFILESMGVAFNEVVVALLDRPGSAAGLRRFTLLLVTTTSTLMLLMAATPLSRLWFGQVAALSPELAALARRALWLALPVPGLVALQSWFQGLLLHSRRTRGITEAVAISMATSVAILISGVVLANFLGLYVGLAALSAGFIGQTAWLWWRSRPALRATLAEESLVVSPEPAAVAGD